MEFTQSEWRNRSLYKQYLEKITSESRYSTGVTADADDQIITLVTCNQSILKQRIIVSAKLIHSSNY